MSVALWVVDCALVIETVKVLYQFSSTAEVIEATWHWYVTIAKVTGGDSGLYSLLQHPTCPTVIDRKNTRRILLFPNRVILRWYVFWYSCNCEKEESSREKGLGIPPHIGHGNLLGWRKLTTLTNDNNENGSGVGNYKHQPLIVVADYILWFPNLAFAQYAPVLTSNIKKNRDPDRSWMGNLKVKTTSIEISFSHLLPVLSKICTHLSSW